MKIAILYNTAWYIYNFRSSLIRALISQGHEVITISPMDEYVARIEAMGVKHFTIPLEAHSTNPLKELKAISAIAAIIRKEKPEVILSYTIKCNLYAGVLRRLMGFKQVANVPGLGRVFDGQGLVNSIARTLYRVGLYSAEKVFFQNREDMEACILAGLVSPTGADLLPGSGVDIEKFRPISSRLFPRPRRFLMLGRLVPKKGYDEFLSSAEVLRKRYGEKSEFWILGIPDKSPDSQALLARIVDADRNGVVRRLEPTDDVRPVLAEVDTVVLPSSYNEGVPRSLLEALASGKVIVTTDWKGCRETVEEGRNGMLVPVGDVEALTLAMEKILLLTPERLAEMGEASRQFAETRFDERIVIAKYLDAVRKLSPSND